MVVACTGNEKREKPLSLQKSSLSLQCQNKKVYHKMGIWQAVDQLPYARKATEERLVGDRYILKVQNTTIAELIGDKSA